MNKIALSKLQVHTKKSKSGSYYNCLVLKTNYGRDFILSYNDDLIKNILNITDSDYVAAYPKTIENVYDIVVLDKDVK